MPKNDLWPQANHKDYSWQHAEPPGVIVDALVDPLANHLIIPAFQGLKRRFGRTPTAA